MIHDCIYCGRPYSPGHSCPTPAAPKRLSYQFRNKTSGRTTTKQFRNLALALKFLADILGTDWELLAQAPQVPPLPYPQTDG